MVGVETRIGWKGEVVVRRYRDDEAYRRGECYSETRAPNLPLTEGMLALCNLLIGAAETNFSQANSYVGVGNSATAPDRAQTGLQGASKAYVQCDASYPTITDAGGGDAGKKIVTWRGVFDGDTGNFSWQEFTVANANSDAGDNLNRATSDQGTKTSGQTWTLDIKVTIG